jgi:hypothetical protein
MKILNGFMPMKLILNLTVCAAVEMYHAAYVYCMLLLHGGLK